MLGLEIKDADQIYVPYLVASDTGCSKKTFFMGEKLCIYRRIGEEKEDNKSPNGSYRPELIRIREGKDR